MKKFLLAVFSLISISAFAQVPTGLPSLFGNKYYLFKNYVGIDSALLFSSADTNFTPIRPAIIFKNSDSSIYLYNKSKWIKIGQGISSETDPTVPSFVKLFTPSDTARWGKVYVDSVKASNDTVYYYKSGTAFFAYKAVLIESDPTVSAVAKTINGTDTLNWNNASRKRIVSASYNPTTNIITFQRNDGTNLQVDITDTSGTVNSGVDTIYRRTDSVFYKKNTIEYFAFIDSVGGGIGSGYVDSIYLRSDSVFYNKVGAGEQFSFKIVSSVTTDATLTGDGTSGDPLKIDTSLIATTNYVDTAKANIRDSLMWSKNGINITPKGGENIVSDTLRAGTVQADEHLLAPLKDTLAALLRKGELRFDEATNTMWYKDNDRWAALTSLTNSLIPNRPNMRLGGTVIRPSVAGSVVTWNFIVDPKHDSIFFNTVTVSSGAVRVGYPTVTKIIAAIAVPDETLAAKIDIGTSVGVDYMDITIKRRVGVYSGLFRGNGTTYSNATGVFTSNYVSATGNFYFSWSPGFTTQEPVAVYVGSNGYHLERQYSSFAGYEMRYIVKDAFGNAVTDAPTTDDAIQVITGDARSAIVNAGVASGDGWAAATFTASTNIWILALFEL